MKKKLYEATTTAKDALAALNGEPDTILRNPRAERAEAERDEYLKTLHAIAYAVDMLAGADVVKETVEEVKQIRRERDALRKDAERMQEALSVCSQALNEITHAQQCGAEWYTNGDRGLYEQVRMWVSKGIAAIAAAKK